jgi:hypothetical protein
LAVNDSDGFAALEADATSALFQEYDRDFVGELYGEYAKSGFSIAESGVRDSELDKESEYNASFRTLLVSGLYVGIKHGEQHVMRDRDCCRKDDRTHRGWISIADVVNQQKNAQSNKTKITVMEDLPSYDQGVETGAK